MDLDEMGFHLGLVGKAPHRLSRGVLGFRFEHRGRIFIRNPMSMCPGAGNVGNFLEGLKQEGKPIVAAVVTNARMAGILQRRGFRMAERIPGG